MVVIIIPLIINICELILLWVTGTIDPGIMKRNEKCSGCHELSIKVVHKGVYKTTKICLTCNIARPFRSHHCSDCDNCAQRFDHYCPWIGGCVAKRNYIYFIFFLVLLNIKNFFLMTFCIVHIVMTFKNVDENEKNKDSWIAKKLKNIMPSLFTIIFIAITMLFTTGLFVYHIILIISNVTTKEEIKKLIFIKIGNSYNRGVLYNCKDFFTRHKTMENNYTVKDLRVKVKPEKNLPSKRTIKPKISPYGEKEKELKNKNDNKNKAEIISNSDSNSKNTKIDENKKNENKKNEIRSRNELYSNKSSDSQINNNQIINKKKNNIKKNNERKQNRNENIEKKNNFNSSQKDEKDESESDYNKNNEVDDFSDINVSEENSNRKIFNTSIKKNNNNINNDEINKSNDYGDYLNKYRFKTNMNEKIFNDNDNKYKIKNSKRRLEDLTSEIIHEEINQLKTSLSIPRENSCTTSLSQN